MPLGLRLRCVRPGRRLTVGVTLQEVVNYSPCTFAVIVAFDVTTFYLLEPQEKDLSFEVYSKKFYEQHAGGSLESARVTVPILLRYFCIKSVIDIGCGVGTWLRAFQENGISDIAGVDGPHIDKATLMIEEDAFTAADLRSEFHVPRRFDLAVSLEVAEHLPEDNSAGFVRRLTDAAPIVLFSAAIPGQPGTGHINMQWQDYWRAIFSSFGYVALDIIRPVVWGSKDVYFWYQQNTIVYCANETIAARADLLSFSDRISLNIVHPLLYNEQRELYLRKAITSIPRLAIKALKTRLNLSKPARE
jgi:SAM-dependent methyltransferase